MHFGSVLVGWGAQLTTEGCRALYRLAAGREISGLDRQTLSVLASMGAGIRPSDMDNELDVPLDPINVAEAATMLGVSTRRVIVLLHDGRLGPRHKRGTSWILDRPNVVAYAEERAAWRPAA